MDTKLALLFDDFMLGRARRIAPKAKTYRALPTRMFEKVSSGSHIGQNRGRFKVCRGVTGINPRIERMSRITAPADQACGE